ncbi:MAG: sporulation peptidase YabG [Clostridia bacterium]|nr:sporulation peptidase YabG [Clostridia bacterium]
MEKLQIGDVVTRKSYNGDVFFKVIRLYTVEDGTEMAEIKGLDVRLAADAPVCDLLKMTPEQVRCHRHQFIQRHTPHLERVFGQRRQSGDRGTATQPQTEAGEGNTPEVNKNSEVADFFEVPGRVLHIDGDPEYLRLCLASYRRLKISAWGYAVPEEQQPQLVVNLLKQHLPDILVLTGHDGLLKGKENLADLESYRNSRYFVEAVKKARQFEMSSDVLLIFAGACQSHYEAILRAGANFASSPKRVLIHAFDPVLVVERLAYTYFDKTVSVNELIRNTITGMDGIGGVETRGKFRRGLPKSPY